MSLEFTATFFPKDARAHEELAGLEEAARRSGQTPDEFMTSILKRAAAEFPHEPSETDIVVANHLKVRAITDQA